MDQVVDTRLATTIGNGQTRISTTEHLLAALHGTGIDNADIKLDSPEVPIMDGSAGPFVRLLNKSGRKKQTALRKVLRITDTISYSDGDKNILIKPYNGFKITGRIQFDNEIISNQEYSVEVTPEHFSKEIAQARTFGFVEQVEQLWANGLALGGTLDNTIAIHWDRRGVLNEEGLRFSDEFVRHKVLDLIGDLALLGCPLLGHVVANRAGHGVHLGLMQEIAKHPECWEQVEFRKNGKISLHKVTSATKNATNTLLPFLLPPTSTTTLPQPSFAI